MTRRLGMDALGTGSLGTRLLLAFALVALSSVLVLTGSALIGVDRGVQAGQQVERQRVADTAAVAAATAYEAAGGWVGADLTRTLGIGDAASARLTVLDTEGSTVTSTGPGMGGMGMMNSEAIVAPVIVQGAQVGAVKVAFPAMVTSRVLDIAWSWILVAAIVALIVAFVASWVVTRLLVGPIRTMTEAAGLFTRGDRQSRARVRAPGELGSWPSHLTGWQTR